jgi:GTPase
VLVYVVDGGEGAEAAPRSATVRRELAAFAAALVERPALIAINKADLMDAAAARRCSGASASSTGRATCSSSRRPAAKGLEELGAELAAMVGAARRRRASGAEAPPPVLRPGADRLDAFTVSREGEGFRVSGEALERLVAKADIDNPEARRLPAGGHRARRPQRRAAARRRLPGDTVAVGEREFEFA